MNRFLPALLVTTAFAAGEGFAGLRWESLQQRLSADPEEKVITVRFPFVNEGSAPVEILGVKTNCGCTGAKPAQNPVGPGQKSDIAVTFRFGDRKGAYSTPVTVKTNDPSAPETKLELIVDIVPPVEIAPKLLFWKKDEALSEKAVTIHRTGRDRIAEVQPGAGTELTLRVEETKAGEDYRLVIDPGAVRKSLRTEVPVSVRFASGKTKETKLHVKVR